jgi:hypothetical protein
MDNLVIYKLYVEVNADIDWEVKLIDSLEEIGVSPTGTHRRGDAYETWLPDPGTETRNKIEALRFSYKGVQIGLSICGEDTLAVNYNGFDPRTTLAEYADKLIGDNGIIINLYKEKRNHKGKSYLNGTTTFWVRAPSRPFERKLGTSERCFYNKKKLQQMLFKPPPAVPPPAVTTPPAATFTIIYGSLKKCL